VYAFGGEIHEDIYTDKCDRINLLDNQWEEIENLPNKSMQTSPVAFCGAILVAGTGIENLLRYDYDLNRFSEILPVPEKTFKFLFVAENRCHLLCGTQSYYISGINDPFDWFLAGKVENFLL